MKAWMELYLGFKVRPEESRYDVSVMNSLRIPFIYRAAIHKGILHTVLVEL